MNVTAARHLWGLLCVSALVLMGCGGDAAQTVPTADSLTTVVTAPLTTTTLPASTSSEPTTTTAVPVTTTEPLVDLESGLLAHYPMDGDARDEGPGAMHGEVFGAVVATDRFDDPAGALRFDGSDDLVVLDEQGFALGGSFSITMWLNGNAASDHQWVLLSDHTAGECQPETPSWILRYNDDAGVFFSIYDSTTECGGHHGYGSPILLDDDRWHHLAMVADGVTLRVYLDCAEVMSVETAMELPDGPYGVVAGNQSGSPPSTAFEGSLDDLRFYGRALDPDEVTALCGA